MFDNDTRIAIDTIVTRDKLIRWKNISGIFKLRKNILKLLSF